MVGRVKLCIWIREARKYKHTVATTSKYAFFAPSQRLVCDAAWVEGIFLLSAVIIRSTPL